MTTEIFREYCVLTGEKPGVGIFQVLPCRSFYFETCKGPAIIVKHPDLLELSSLTAKEYFHMRRVDPFDPGIPEHGKYELLRPHRTVIDGLYVDLQPGEFVELSAAEALSLLLKSKIRLAEEVSNASKVPA